MSKIPYDDPKLERFAEKLREALAYHGKRVEDELSTFAGRKRLWDALLLERVRAAITLHQSEK